MRSISPWRPLWTFITNFPLPLSFLKWSWAPLVAGPHNNAYTCSIAHRGRNPICRWGIACPLVLVGAGGSQTSLLSIFRCGEEAGRILQSLRLQWKYQDCVWCRRWAWNGEGHSHLYPRGSGVTGYLILGGILWGGHHRSHSSCSLFSMGGAYFSCDLRFLWFPTAHRLLWRGLRVDQPWIHQQL